jgi:hypothetical protein
MSHRVWFVLAVTVAAAATALAVFHAAAHQPISAGVHAITAIAMIRCAHQIGWSDA